MTIVVGIDGGGTKTRAASYCWEGSRVSLGKLLGEASAGPCNIAFMPVDEALASVRDAALAAGIEFAAVDSVCAAVAGYSFRSRRSPFLSGLTALFCNAKVALAPDFEAAFRGAFPNERGIIVIAGTGSVAYGADGSGRSHRAGGYGYKIDDAGSGYGVGRQALAAVLQAIDGAGEQTVLTERIGALAGMSADWDALIEGIYGGVIDRVAVAALAETVSLAAGEGDEVSRRILMRAGGSLAWLAQTVHRRVHDGASSVSIALAGSLWNAGPSLTDVFERSVREFAPEAQITRPDADPALGAAWLAADLLR